MSLRPVTSPRIAAAGTLAAALLLCLPGPSLAAGRPDGGEAAAQAGTRYESIGPSNRPLARGAGYVAGGDRARVRALQRSLRSGEYAPGPVDGLYGPLTEAAVLRFQRAHRLVIDGVVGPQTMAALRARSAARTGTTDRVSAIRPGTGYRSPGGAERVRDLQLMLSAIRYETGPLDGVFGPQTQAAVQWFQVKHGVPPTGIAGRATLTRLHNLARAARRDPAPAELEVPPLPAAGPGGHPIRHPHQRASRTASFGSARREGLAGPLRPGAGYRSAAGSRRVRQLQRNLRRLGYRPGVVDGRYGPQTEAALQWFQMKHGLRPSGVAGLATVAQLRALATGTRGAPRAPTRANAPKARANAPRTGANAPSPLPRAAPPARAADEPGDGISPLLLVVLVGGALAVAALSVLMLRRIGPERAGRALPPDDAAPLPSTAAPTTPRAGEGEAAAAAPAEPPVSRTPSPTVVGYASGRNRGELDRGAAAVTRACRERGSTLACVIRENGSANGNGRKRPGLAHAVTQVHEGRAGGLVLDCLDHLGHSDAEICAQLEWFLNNDVDLVAVDVGLDTSTDEGRLEAGRLLNGRSPVRT
jgi:peptidoglycan hydrolase-like protein with peptidoglycan-binding domain